MKPKSNLKIPAKDLCQTPAYALEPLLPYLKAYKHRVIWEPAVGEGYLYRAIRDAGFSVVGTDIQTGDDFFEFKTTDYDLIVTNPPFSLKYKWMAHCYKLGKPFALLMPVDTIAAKSAQLLWQKHGIEIILLDARVDFKMPNKGWDGKGSPFSVEWFTWGLNIGRTFSYAHLEKKKWPKS